MELILRTLTDHFAECQDYWNKLVEHDADYIKQETARARMSGVEECVQLVRKVRDALEKCGVTFDGGYDMNDVDAIIADMPSTDEWIPCTERLPEIEREGQRRGWYLTTNGYGSVGETRYEFYNDFKETGWQSDIQIVAWMPMPEAYRRGGE